MAFELSWLRGARADGRAQAEAALPAVYTAALRLTGDAAEAEVLVECAYRTCAARGSRSRPVRVRFELLDMLYTAWRQRHGSPVGARSTPPPSGLELPARPLSLDRVVAALSALPDTLWHPLWLRDNQGLRYEEIALLLDVSKARVANLVSQARLELIRRLRCDRGARHGGGPPTPPAAPGPASRLSPVTARVPQDVETPGQRRGKGLNRTLRRG